MNSNRMLRKECDKLWKAGKLHTRNPQLLGLILGIDTSCPTSNDLVGDYPVWPIDDHYVTEPEYYSGRITNLDLFTYIMKHELKIGFKSMEFFTDNYDYDRHNEATLVVYYDDVQGVVYFTDDKADDVLGCFQSFGYIYSECTDGSSLFELTHRPGSII